MRQYGEMKRLMKAMQGGKRGAMQKLAQRFSRPGMKVPF
jgi:hypothetical protein